MLVDVTTSLSSGGVLSWTLQALDPTTGLPPTDPSVGILPPDTVRPEGEGEVLVFAALRPGLVTGATLSNTATITFDANAPITTNEWINTLDASAPSSAVSQLPSVERAPDFSVSWTGEDVGSGIDNFSVYVSADGGPYVPWLTQTRETTATFAGQPGVHYSFYSVAQDAVGNVESPPASSDTTTTVDLPPTFTTGVSDVRSVDYHDPITPFTISATDPDDNGTTLTISASGLPAGLTMTDNHDGTATVSGTPTAAAGVYAPEYTVSDSGGPITVQGGPITIRTEETATTYTGAASVLPSGSSAKLSGLLKEDGTTPISGRALVLTLGSQSCTGTTDSSGNANCAVTINQSLGPVTVSASFAGDSFYQPSSDQKTTYLFAFPAGGGTFVIGDGNAALGSKVTFWGAQWSSANTLSGGNAPSAFKGFANNPATPGCGVGWNTGPGGSSGPPSPPLPSYMGVIVTSSVMKSGSTISGNTVHIVVVQTNAGYDASPGKAGTGTVVATVC